MRQIQFDWNCSRFQVCINAVEHFDLRPDTKTRTMSAAVLQKQLLAWSSSFFLISRFYILRLFVKLHKDEILQYMTYHYFEDIFYPADMKNISSAAQLRSFLPHFTCWDFFSQTEMTCTDTLHDQKYVDSCILQICVCVTVDRLSKTVSINVLL